MWKKSSGPESQRILEKCPQKFYSDQGAGCDGEILADSAKFPIARRSKIRCRGAQRAPLSFKALQRAEGEAQSSRNGGDQSAFFPPRFRAMHDDRGALCLQSAFFAAGRAAVSPPLRDHGAQHRRWRKRVMKKMARARRVANRRNFQWPQTRAALVLRLSVSNRLPKAGHHQR